MSDFAPNGLAPGNVRGCVQVSAQHGFLGECDPIPSEKHAYVTVDVFLLAVDRDRVLGDGFPDLTHSGDQLIKILL